MELKKKMIVFENAYLRWSDQRKSFREGKC